MTAEAGINPTLRRFEYPALLLRDYDHWAVLLRRHQVTLGALILAARDDVTAWPALDAEAFTELALITDEIEATLKAAFAFNKINYLMLMMNDPNPHFHVIPRYERRVTFHGTVFEDPGWPKPPDLAAGPRLDDDTLSVLLTRLATSWVESA